MEEAVQHYYSEILALSTKVDSAGQKRFFEFCFMHSMNDVLPVTQDLLCYFVSYLVKKRLG